MGVRPTRNRFLDLLRLTMLKIILWSSCTFSTEKLNQNLYLGLQVSGLTYKSYSNSLMKSTLPRFPDSNIASKQRCPFLALPECPGGLITTFSTLPSPPSLSLSSESKQTYFSSHVTRELSSFVAFSKLCWVATQKINDGIKLKRIQKARPATYTMAVQLIALVSAIFSDFREGKSHLNLLWKIFISRKNFTETLGDFWTGSDIIRGELNETLPKVTLTILSSLLD